MQRYEVAHAGEIKNEKAKIVRAGGTEIGIFRVNGEYRAYRNVCPHAFAPICTGRVTGNILRCPWHDWEFDLRTGEHVRIAACSLTSHVVEVENDRLFVSA